MDASNDWILCVLPNEALSEELEATLLEWKGQDPEETLTAARFRYASRTASAGTSWNRRSA